MGSISKVIPSAARPVYIGEFVRELLKIWRPSRQINQGVCTLGLAISGGVDSMALAALCSQLPYWEPYVADQNSVRAALANIHLRAFIVNHGVRDGSDIEAEVVSKELEQRGIRTSILTIDWPGRCKPAKLSNFESLARKHRFQLLGQACKDHDIESLLLAHHEEDQAETVMMRMVNGHRGLGLIGIKASSEIPECYGIYGVHQSGRYDYHWEQNHISSLIRKQKCSADPPVQPPSGYMLHNSLLCTNRLSPLLSEDGGVRLYRPLLGFSKASLIATCMAQKMPWFEDYTNKDPTVTTRNAIRHIYSNHDLPAALSRQALLKLSEGLRSKNLVLYGKELSWLTRSSITNFCNRTGTLRIRFFYKSRKMRKEPSQSRTSASQDRQVAALLLRRIVGLVTPKEHISLNSLHSTVEHIFPELFTLGETLPATTFTVAGVKFQPLPSPTLSDETGQCLHEHDWLISRQPYHSNGDKQPLIIIPPIQLSLTHSWSPWALYDGRYWVRILNYSATPILIRPFRKEDLLPFRSSLIQADQKVFRQLLKEFAPGDVRWTLPAIACQENDGKETVLALPTLDIGALDVATLVRWEVRYKKVDTKGLWAREPTNIT